MLSIFKKSQFNLGPSLIIIFFVVMLVWWASIGARGLVDTNENFYFGLFMGILPIFAAVFGFINSKKWGYFRSSVGKAIGFLSAGLVTWGIGTLIFAYYNFTGIDVPYPSLADAAYILSWPLWAFGIISLSKATGARFGAKNIKGRAMLFVIPIAVIAFSYYFLVTIALQGAVSAYEDIPQTFFDLAYPIGDIVILSLALLVYGLSFKYLGGKLKIPILIILVGFVINYFADFSFSYTTTQETFFVANWVDLIFTTAMFAIGLGVSLFNPQNKHTKDILQDK